MGFFGYFSNVIIISLFWSLLITTVLYTMPESDRDIIAGFSDADGINTDYEQTTVDFQDSLDTQKKFGLVDLAALALYSGNIMLDLAGNFLFAIPSMFSLLFWGIFQLIHINIFLEAQILLWIKGLFSIITTILLLKFLLGIRTQSLGAV